MCESCGVKSTAYTRMVMTIREKCADQRFYVAKYKDSSMVFSFFYMGNMTDKKNLATIKIYIDGKEMLYSHQNIIGAINSFLPYLTNDDLDELMLRFHTLIDHRRQKEYLAHLEAKVIPIQKNRHDT